MCSFYGCNAHVTGVSRVQHTFPMSLSGSVSDSELAATPDGARAWLCIPGSLVAGLRGSQGVAGLNPGRTCTRQAPQPRYFLSRPKSRSFDPRVTVFCLSPKPGPPGGSGHSGSLPGLTWGPKPPSLVPLRAMWGRGSGSGGHCSAACPLRPVQP